VVYETIKQEGFLIVILGRQQLFTENTLTVVLPVLRRRDSLMFANVARLWSTVLAANIAGALLFAWVGARTSIFSPFLPRRAPRCRRSACTRWSRRS